MYVCDDYFQPSSLVVTFLPLQRQAIILLALTIFHILKEEQNGILNLSSVNDKTYVF